MATSSITKTFVISGKKQAEKFAKAIKKSEKSLKRAPKVKGRLIEEPAELIALIEKRSEQKLENN